MFREGQYLEVIKTPDGCVATAIVTIKEKTVEYKNKAIKTNKWLDLQDWASLYGIIRKAIIRNNENRSNGKRETTERRKSTRQLEVTYKFEDAESPDDGTSLPTIRVSVKPARKSAPTTSDLTSDGTRKLSTGDAEKYSSARKTRKSRKSGGEHKSFLSEDYCLEEYVPPALPNSTRSSNVGLKYVPSRKSMLLRMRRCATTDENKYTPEVSTNRRLTSPTTTTTAAGTVAAATATANDSHTEVSYIPNPIKSLTKLAHETYDPCCATILPADLSEAYVPSSKGARTTRTAIEEYEPDFAIKTMKFDDSYVPSSTNFKSHKDEARKKNKKSSSGRPRVPDIPQRQL